MTTRSSKPDSRDSQLVPGREYSSDVLIFDNQPLSVRLFFSIFTFAIAIGCGICYIYAVSTGDVFIGLVFAIVAIVFISIASHDLGHVDKLVIDFSRQTYELCSGDISNEIKTTGSLDEVNHLSVRYHIRNGRKSDYHCVQVSMIWKNDRHQPFILKSKAKGELDMLLTDPFSKTTWIERSRKELKTYADELAARFQVPVV